MQSLNCSMIFNVFECTKNSMVKFTFLKYVCDEFGQKNTKKCLDSFLEGYSEGCLNSSLTHGLSNIGRSKFIAQNPVGIEH